MDDRFGRPCNKRMEQSHPGFDNRWNARQGPCVKTDRGPQRTEGPGMNPRSAARGAEQTRANVQMKTMRFSNKDDRSPYLANDLCDARGMQMRGDANRNRIYTDSRAEMRNSCLDMNRGPQKDGEFLGWKNRGPQKDGEFLGWKNRSPQTGDTRTMSRSPQTGGMNAMSRGSQTEGVKTATRPQAGGMWTNRGPQRPEDMAFKNRSPQKAEAMGTGVSPQRGPQDRMQMKNICDYKSRRPAGWDSQKR